MTERGRRPANRSRKLDAGDGNWTGLASVALPGGRRIGYVGQKLVRFSQRRYARREEDWLCTSFWDVPSIAPSGTAEFGKDTRPVITSMQCFIFQGGDILG